MAYLTERVRELVKRVYAAYSELIAWLRFQQPKNDGVIISSEEIEHVFEFQIITCA